MPVLMGAPQSQTKKSSCYHCIFSIKFANRQVCLAQSQLLVSYFTRSTRFLLGRVAISSQPDPSLSDYNTSLPFAFPHGGVGFILYSIVRPSELADLYENTRHYVSIPPPPRSSVVFRTWLGTMTFHWSFMKMTRTFRTARPRMRTRTVYCNSPRGRGQIILSQTF